MSSFNLLSHTAPAQAGTLLLLGPFLDYWLTNKRIDEFKYSMPSVVSIPVLESSFSCYTNFILFYFFGGVREGEEDCLTKIAFHFFCRVSVSHHLRQVFACTPRSTMHCAPYNTDRLNGKQLASSFAGEF